MEIKWKRQENDLPEHCEEVWVLRVDGSVDTDCFYNYNGWREYSKSKVIAWASIPKKEDIIQDIS